MIVDFLVQQMNNSDPIGNNLPYRSAPVCR
jgi:hypothetical protein